MITLILIIAFIIGLVALRYTYKLYREFPKAVIIAFVIGTLIGFLTIGRGFLNNHILDIYHPVYSDPESSVSTLSFLISLIGGVILAGPVAIVKIIKRLK